MLRILAGTELHAPTCACCAGHRAVFRYLAIHAAVSGVLLLVCLGPAGAYLAANYAWPKQWGELSAMRFLPPARYVAAVCGGAGLVLLALCYMALRGGASLRLATLLAGVAAAECALGPAAYWALHERLSVAIHYADLARLRVEQKESSALYLIDSRRLVEGKTIESVADLHAAAMRPFPQLRQSLAEDLQIEDQATLKAIYLMYFVCDLWSFGNARHPELPGGLFDNEDNKWQGPAVRNIQAAVNSHIANCSDMATALKALLDQEGIESQLLIVPGHVFLEVNLPGGAAVLDPTIDCVLRSGWSESIDRKEVPVWSFRHPKLIDESHADYRPRVAQWRMVVMGMWAQPPESWRTPKSAELPPLFLE